MSFIKSLSPFYTPPTAAREGGLLVLRERILHVMLLSLALLGIPIVIEASNKTLLEPIYSFPAIYLYGAIYIITLLVMFNRRWSYSFRGHVLITIVYVLAISELFESGQLGEVRMFLLAYIALTAVLLNASNVI